MGGLHGHPFGGTPPSSSPAGRPSISSLMVGRGGRYGSMGVICMVFLCERHCVPLRPCWPPVPPTSGALPPLRVLPVCPPVLLFFFFGCPRVRALRCSRAPCVCPLLFSVLPLSRSPMPPHSPVSPPILLLAVDPACTSVCPPCLSPSVTRGCLPRALPLPLSVAPTLSPGVSPTLVFSRSPSLTPSWFPCALCVCGGGVSADWTVALPEDWHGRWVPTHHVPPHLPKEHRQNDSQTLVELFRCICTVQPSRIDQLRRCCTELFQSDQSPQSDPAWSPRVHTSLHLACVPWRRRPPRPGAFRVSRGQPLRAGQA